MLTRLKILLPAWILLLLLAFGNDSFWPLTWPDEALFSSPAASLAEKGVFATPVLKGLIPGMERATLWNSPLYMVLLSGFYSFTGEHRWVGRLLSTLLILLSLFPFLELASHLTPRLSMRRLALLMVALDLTLLRAARTIRMDSLTLLFFLLTLLLLYRAHLRRATSLPSKESGSLPASLSSLWGLPLGHRGEIFLAGLCTGLAALSHPVAVILVPVWLILVLPRWRDLLVGAGGTLLSFSPWLFYILPNLSIFRLQFLSQLGRKSSMLTLWGGDTGGIFVVFSSQYGGNKFLMLGALLTFLVVGGVGLLAAWKRPQSWRSDPFLRLFLVYGAVFGMVLLFSEGWYALYVGPLALLVALDLYSRSDADSSSLAPALLKTPLAMLLLFFAGSTLFFSFRHHVLYHTPGTVTRFNAALLEATKECRSIYLRVRPDPYFLLRRQRPGMEILEFVPGKLRFPEERGAQKEKRYDTIHCFLVDEHGSWEPEVTHYLESRKDSFQRTPLLPSPPLEGATLWIRTTPPSLP